ncbi:TniB family NTP-binding protein [Devosia chinhatensis]|uniref:AAA+ ATPase domain-containing protein n=1 Tax=Devosia chinhatensis TaxID=429727 RepID=A0A0F5FJ21_9HYPH|nr:TniB family NTP-binding protein [Devosia chinhatensis]KKB08798.1 hypothetical protein VE26_01625 [Devosia chinhatensis]
MLNLELLKNIDGMYPDDIAKILTTQDPEKKRILTVIGTKVIEYSQYNEAWDWLEDVLNEAGTGMEATAGLLYGPSGVGKTTVLRQFVGHYGGPFKTPSGIKRPVVRVSTPANPTLPNMLKAMVLALGAEEASSDNVTDLKSVLLRQMSQQQVKLLIFDEFTHVVEDRTERFASKAVRGLKELLGENICQCVFAGTEQLASLHDIYKQFRRRSGGDLPMLPFDWNDAGDKKEWTEIMEGLQGELPLPCASPLGDAAMAKKMHLATDGLLDHVMKLLFRATSYAYDDGKEAVDDPSLSSAFEVLRRGDRRRANPFGPSSRRRRELTFRKDVAATDVHPHADDVTNLRSAKQKLPDFAK